MPYSLMDLFGGGAQQQDDPYSQGGLGGHAQSLIGLGMGLLQPTPIGGSAWANALRGFQGGAAIDAQTADRAAQRAMQRQHMGLERERFNLEKSRMNITEAQKAMQDVLGPNPAPEEKTKFMRDWYNQRMEGDWGAGSIKDPDSEREYPYQVNKRTGEIRWPMGAAPGYGGGAPQAPQTPPQTAQTPQPPTTDGGGAVPYVDPTGAPAVPAVAPPIGPSQTSIGNVPIPPDLRPSERREFRKKIVQDQASQAIGGKLTESQAKDSGFAARMENAERDVRGVEQQGLNTGARALEDYAPNIIGNRFQSPEYQRYTVARSQFITALLRRESGAAIAPHEFTRYDREFFPQPGDGPQVIEQKRQARAVATEQMKRGAGPSYRSPEASPGQEAPRAPAGGRTGGAGLPAPAAAIQALRANPGLRDEFDAKYDGTAHLYLGQ